MSKISAAEVLKMDQKELNEIVKTRTDEDGVITFIEGVQYLSPTSKEQFRRKICEAHYSRHHDPQQLFERLLDVQQGRERTKGSPSPARSVQRTLSPEDISVTEFRYYDELVRLRGRPACSKEEFERLKDNYKLGGRNIKAWLLYEGSSGGGGRPDMHGFFQRQVERRFEFRKSQLANRRITFVEDEINEYICSDERTSRMIWDMQRETMRRIWEGMRRRLRITEQQEFQDYEQMVKDRIADRFPGQSLRLNKDPRLQSALDDWFEYLVFEELELESWERRVLSLEDTLLTRAVSLRVYNEYETPVPNISAAASNKLWDTIQDYIGIHSLTHQQGHRVHWAMEEAYKMQREQGRALGARLGPLASVTAKKRPRDIQSHVEDATASSRPGTGKRRRLNGSSDDQKGRVGLRRSARIRQLTNPSKAAPKT